jgi:hypothetical protein
MVKIALDPARYRTSLSSRVGETAMPINSALSASFGSYEPGLGMTPRPGWHWCPTHKRWERLSHWHRDK